jgi:hypothetical protein
VQRCALSSATLWAQGAKIVLVHTHVWTYDADEWAGLEHFEVSTYILQRRSVYAKLAQALTDAGGQLALGGVITQGLTQV